MEQKEKSKKILSQRGTRPALLRFISNFLILSSLIVLSLIFAPVIKEETGYQIRQVTQKPVDLTPPNTDFSIVVPKIAAVSAVIENVDSQDSKKYLNALRRGVAHAAGTSLPGRGGNIYLFAHSTDAFYNVGYYNAIFYLIGKLQDGDEIDVYYKGSLHKYEVYDKKVVSAEDIRYLGRIDDTETLTLQTCYPPGTTLKRLVVLAKKVGD